MKLVTIDIGNFQFKVKCRERISFNSAYRQGFESNINAFEHVCYNGVTTVIGNGTIEREFNKINRVIEPQILYGISKATEERDINLCLLLPIAQLMQREILIEQ